MTPQRNTEAQHAARAQNAKRGGAPVLCECGHKRNEHVRNAAGVFMACSAGYWNCDCEKYQPREGKGMK